MPRTCVFCGGSPTTNEHLWPDWARRRSGYAEPLDHRQHARQDGRAPIDREWKTPPLRTTVKAVCAECNNGWMSRLEGSAKPMLLSMLEGRGRALHRDGQRTLAAWGLKTAMMVEHTLSAEKQVVPEEEHAHLLEHGEPSDRVVIWMATYIGTMPGSCRLFGLDADVTQGPDRGRRDMWGVTVTFGPVVFQVFGTTVPLLLEGLAINHPGVQQIWPYQRSFTWTPRAGFADEDLAQFADALLVELQKAGGSPSETPRWALN
jgi:hypothetical protein